MQPGAGDRPTADQTTRCPRCRSGNTVDLDDRALVGYRKCIICGQCWSVPELGRRALLTAPDQGDSTDSAV